MWDVLENKQHGNSQTWDISYEVQERIIKDPLVCISTTVTGWPFPILFIFQTIITVSGSKKIPKCRCAATEFLKTSYMTSGSHSVHFAVRPFSISDKYSRTQLSLYEKSCHTKTVESLWTNTCYVYNEQKMYDVIIVILTDTVCNV
jgi:hypothetical protein